MAGRNKNKGEKDKKKVKRSKDKKGKVENDDDDDGAVAAASEQRFEEGIVRNVRGKKGGKKRVTSKKRGKGGFYDIDNGVEEASTTREAHSAPAAGNGGKQLSATQRKKAERAAKKAAKEAKRQKVLEALQESGDADIVLTAEQRKLAKRATKIAEREASEKLLRKGLKSVARRKREDRAAKRAARENKDHCVVLKDYLREGEEEERAAAEEAARAAEEKRVAEAAKRAAAEEAARVAEEKRVTEVAERAAAEAAEHLKNSFASMNIAWELFDDEDSDKEGEKVHHQSTENGNADEETMMVPLANDNDDDYDDSDDEDYYGIEELDEATNTTTLTVFTLPEGVKMTAENGELVLEDGRRIGHRSMIQKYRQKSNRSEKMKLAIKDFKKQQQLRKANMSRNSILFKAARFAKGNSKALASIYTFRQRAAFNKHQKAIVHHWGAGGGGSHYHSAGCKAYNKGNKKKGMLLRHSRQGARLQAARNRSNRGTASSACLQ